jgi:thymidylate synthase
MIANMRSTDLIFGLANDVPAFTFMQEMMAFELGLELGAYIHVSNSLHIYERHFEMCEKILEGFPNYTERPVAMPPITLPMPVDSLDKLQWAARATEDSLLLRRLAHAVAEPQAEYDVLWRDWARILVLHRADKLKLEDARKEIVSSLESPQFKQIA